MYRVIQGILLDAQVIENLPDWTLGPGLLVTMDIKVNSPEESLVVDSFVESYSAVRVHCPDGTFLDCKATAVGFSGENVSLFFKNLNKNDIPILSRIQLFSAVLPDPQPS